MDHAGEEVRRHLLINQRLINLAKEVIANLGTRNRAHVDHVRLTKVFVFSGVIDVDDRCFEKEVLIAIVDIAELLQVRTPNADQQIVFVALRFNGHVLRLPVSLPWKKVNVEFVSFIILMIGELIQACAVELHFQRQFGDVLDVAAHLRGVLQKRKRLGSRSTARDNLHRLGELG